MDERGAAPGPGDDTDDGRAAFLARPLRRRELIALDALAALAYPVVLLAYPFSQDLAARSWGELPLWAVWPLVAATAAPLAVRRLWPLPVLGAVLAATAVSVALLGVREPFLAVAFALYPVALSTPRRRWEPSVAIAVGCVVLAATMTTMGSPVGTGGIGMVLIGLVLIGGSWTIGRAVRERRAYAERTAERLAERLAERAVTEERLRIARELHDVVAHGMSLVAVKAGVARHVLRERPEEAADALGVIETASRSALTEMRHMLGVLRSESDGPGGDLAPAPGLDGLPELAERAARAGVRVELDVRVPELPEGLRLAVFRIVQEAVTNAVRHAAPTRCRVTVAARAGQVAVDVADDGPGGRPSREAPPERAAGPGHGLIGMRERVAVYGGSFTAGPRSGGGFAVSARLPYQAAAVGGAAR
ncbi:sensor histidine kinase [Allonocardiopsis opalescens]|uniref:sensor histidine kinase n=1 Tax=Allonocardiopsis opalescens TaxID=1144618 RepID=UPI001B80AB76|nr:sensor histidine kinase [Allonocardiopsis opalescens]